MMTRTKAEAIAHKLREACPQVLDVELFGSVASNGQGHDADFAVTVDDTLASQWWKRERESIRVRWPNSLYKYRWIIKKFAPYVYERTARARRAQKLSSAMEMLGIHRAQFAEADGSVPDFELFLVPRGWQSEGVFNIERMRHITDLADDTNTCGLLSRAARQSIPI